MYIYIYICLFVDWPAPTRHVATFSLSRCPAKKAGDFVLCSQLKLFPQLRELSARCHSDKMDISQEEHNRRPFYGGRWMQPLHCPDRCFQISPSRCKTLEAAAGFVFMDGTMALTKPEPVSARDITTPRVGV